MTWAITHRPAGGWPITQVHRACARPKQARIWLAEKATRQSRRQLKKLMNRPLAGRPPVPKAKPLPATPSPRAALWAAHEALSRAIEAGEPHDLLLIDADLMVLDAIRLALEPKPPPDKEPVDGEA